MDTIEDGVLESVEFFAVLWNASWVAVDSDGRAFIIPYTQHPSD